MCVRRRMYRCILLGRNIKGMHRYDYRKIETVTTLSSNKLFHKLPGIYVSDYRSKIIAYNCLTTLQAFANQRVIVIITFEPD